MSSPGTEGTLSQTAEAEIPPGNTVATIGLIITLAAGVMCGVLFAAARGLPDAPPQPRPTAPPVSEPDAADPNTEEDPEVIAAREAERVRAEEREKQRKAEEDAQRLRVLLLASTTAVLNLVGLCLCVVGLFVPNRPRAIAVGGTILSLILFAGVFGVMAVGALLNSAVTIW